MKIFIFLYFVITSLSNLFAEDFIISCQKLPIKEMSVLHGFRCELINELEKYSGGIRLDYSINSKVLNISGINIKEKYRGRGLSSILLYHAIKTAQEKGFDFDTLELTDVS